MFLCICYNFSEVQLFFYSVRYITWKFSTTSPGNENLFKSLRKVGKIACFNEIKENTFNFFRCQATRFSQYDRTDKRNKEPWRFGNKRKSSTPLHDSESIEESITIPPPKYTPPATASEQVAVDSIYPVESRSPKSLKRCSSTSKQHNTRNKLDTDNRMEDTEEDRVLLIKVPRGEFSMFLTKHTSDI